jgi:hypothetical protein
MMKDVIIGIQECVKCNITPVGVGNLNTSTIPRFSVHTCVLRCIGA